MHGSHHLVKHPVFVVECLPSGAILIFFFPSFPVAVGDEDIVKMAEIGEEDIASSLASQGYSTGRPPLGPTPHLLPPPPPPPGAGFPSSASSLLNGVGYAIPMQQDSEGLSDDEERLVCFVLL